MAVDVTWSPTLFNNQNWILLVDSCSYKDVMKLVAGYVVDVMLLNE